MNTVTMLRVVLAGIFFIPVYSRAFAQTSWKAGHCRNSATGVQPRGPKVVVDDLVLDGTTDVAQDVWNQIVAETKLTTFFGDGWVEEFQEVGLRGGLQNAGYFKSETSAEAKVVSASPAVEHVVVHAKVRAGPRYTLSRVEIRNQDSERHLAFSAEELRPLVPLGDGEIFSVEKVRDGLDKLTRYYRSQGYIDFVPKPETDIDEIHQQVALVIALDEGPQFRLGNIEILGLEPMLEQELRSKIKSGDILNFQLIVDFYQEHRSELPEEVLPEDTDIHRNIKERTADVLFDFRSCSQLQN